MARPAKLSSKDIQGYLQEQSSWEHEGNSITKQFVLANFASAIGFVNAVAILAEKLDHHPDILIAGWNKVTITLTTHDQGGLTALDFQLSKEIDSI
jgi:4a-hydroxytetrahydrobiopterin dehydratase